MNVIVEPDTLGPWLGLGGVVAGALLGFGGAWGQQRVADRKGQSREANQAAADLLTGANGLRMTVGALAVSTGDGAELRHWVPLITELQKQVEQADLTLTRLSAKPLADAAHDLNEAARQYVQSRGAAADKTDLATKITVFSDAARNAQA